MTRGSSNERVRFSEHPSALKLLLLSSGISLVGTELFEITVLMLSTVTYGALVSPSGLGVAMRLAPILMSPLVVAYFERRPERQASYSRITVLLRAGAIATTALVVQFASAPPALIYLLVAIVSALDVSFLASTRAMIPPLTSECMDRSGQLSAANGRLVSQWNAVQIIIPPVAVWILAWLSPGGLLGFASVFLLAAFVLFASPVRAARSASGHSATGQTQGTIRSRLAAGFRMLLDSPSARVVTVLGAFNGAAIFTVSLSLPNIALDLGQPFFTGFGLTALAVGSIFGARWSAKLRTNGERLRVILRCGLGIALASFAMALPVFGPPVPILVVLCFGFGFCAGVGASARSAVLQMEFEPSAIARLIVSAAVFGQLLMPVLPILWDVIYRTPGGIPAASLAIGLTQIGAWLYCVRHLGRHPRHAAMDERYPVA